MSGLPGYTRFDFEQHAVFEAGEGRAVLVLHEMPGLHTKVVAFADRLVAHGYHVYLPSLFGPVGENIGTGLPAGLRMGRALVDVCISRQFHLLRERTSPAVTWLRRLAAHAHERCGGPGVGVVGMCITGGFALAMAIDDVVVAPVLSQPSLPYALPTRTDKIGISPTDLARVSERIAAGLDVLALRFSEDRLCPAARFTRLSQELGSGLEAVAVPSQRGNAAGIPTGAHSVLAEDFVDEPGHPTRAALERVIEFLDERLTAGSPS